MPDTQSYYVPFQRYEEVEFVEDGMEDEIPFRAKIRTNLTFAEADELTWADDADVRADVWPKFAPYVVSWNLRGMDAKGKLVDIPAPADGGADQFQYIPAQLFWNVAREIKLRNMGHIDPKRKSRPAVMAVTDAAAK